MDAHGFARTISSFLVQGDDAVLGKLRAQLERARVTDLITSDRTFEVRYELPDDVEPIPFSLLQAEAARLGEAPDHTHTTLGDVQGMLAGHDRPGRFELFLDASGSKLSHVAGAWVYPVRGVPELAELFYASPMWIEELEDERMVFGRTPVRSLDYVRGVWANLVARRQRG